jgi:hypothetical protein
MDDIFKSKDEEQREEKINNLFKSSRDFKKEEIQTALETENVTAIEPEKKGRKVFGKFLLVLLFLGLAGAAGYFFWQYKKAVNDTSASAALVEAEKITEKIKNLIELPKEVPVVTEITDREKLQNQTFFTNAQNGDKILMYIQSQKIILYRPSLNEITGTASLFSESASETEARIAEACAAKNVSKPAEKIANKVKVDVLNGTEIKGLAKETADKLTGMENVELAKLGNAQKSTYTKILVVDLSGKNETAAKIIAEKVGGEVGSLPEGEVKGTADILVITVKQ